MNECICGYNVNNYRKELGEEKLYYCPDCGRMLIQKCPYGDCSHEFEVYSEKSCPVCKNEIVFCEECGKINLNSEDKCVYCCKVIKKVENIFLSNCANADRTNTYISMGTTDIEIKNKHTVNINVEFSKAVIRNDIIYFWKKHENNRNSMTWCNIWASTENDLKSSDIKCNINFNDIAEIEIFNKYIVTCLNPDSIRINSITDGNPICDVIDIKKLSSSHMAILHYKVAVLGDFLIVVLASANGEEVLSLDINNITNINYVHNIKRYDTTYETGTAIKINANPAILNNNCAYFIGYAKKVYKFTLNENQLVLEFDEMPIEFPTMLPENDFCFGQITTLDQNIVYLTGYTGNSSYLFKLQNNKFTCAGTAPNFVVNKISYLNSCFYALGKDCTQNKFRFTRYSGNWGDFNYEVNTNDFDSGTLKNNYYIAALRYNYLIYMQDDKSLNLSKILCRQINSTGKVDKGYNNEKILYTTKNYLKPEFFIYENYIILCDHNQDKNIIIVECINNTLDQLRIVK